MVLFLSHFFWDSNGQQHLEKSFVAYTHKCYAASVENNSAFAITGTANDSAWGDWDFFLTKADLNGNILFSKRYSEPFHWDEATDIIQVSDGGYLISIYSDSISMSGFIPYPGIIRLDSSGNVIWNKKMMTSKPSYIFAITECMNGDFILAGKQDGVLYGTDAIIIRTNQNGDTLWSKKIGTPGYGNEVFNDVIETSDNSILAIGNTPVGTGAGDIFVTKYNSSGDSLWTKIYGTAGSDYGYCITETANNNFYISGATNFYTIGKQGIFIGKLNTQGDLLQNNLLGLNYSGYAYRHLELTNGDLVFTGTIKTDSGGVGDGFIAKTDSAGNFIDASSYVGYSYDELRDLILTSDSSIIAIGTNTSFQNASQKTLFIKHPTNQIQSCIGENIFLNDSILIYNTQSGLPVFDNPFSIVSKSFTPIDIPLIDTAFCDYVLNTEAMLNHSNMKYFLYPNPSGNFIRLYFNVPISDSSFEISVSNLLGQIFNLKFQKSDNNQLTIDINSIPSGLYFVIITTKTERTALPFLKE